MGKNYSDAIIEIENLKLYITNVEDEKTLMLRNMIKPSSNEMEVESLSADLECSKKEIFSLEEKMSDLIKCFNESKSDVGALKAELIVAHKRLKVKKRKEGDLKARVSESQ